MDYQLKGFSPLQLWHTGVRLNLETENTIIDGVLRDDSNQCGIMTPGPLPVIQTNNVIIPENVTFQTEKQLTSLEQIINPLHDDGNHGIQMYQDVCNIQTMI